MQLRAISPIIPRAVCLEFLSNDSKPAVLGSVCHAATKDEWLNANHRTVDQHVEPSRFDHFVAAIDRLQHQEQNAGVMPKPECILGRRNAVEATVTRCFKLMTAGWRVQLCHAIVIEFNRPTEYGSGASWRRKRVARSLCKDCLAANLIHPVPVGRMGSKSLPI